MKYPYLSLTSVLAPVDVPILETIFGMTDGESSNIACNFCSGGSASQFVVLNTANSRPESRATSSDHSR